MNTDDDFGKFADLGEWAGSLEPRPLPVDPLRTVPVVTPDGHAALRLDGRCSGRCSAGWVTYTANDGYDYGKRCPTCGPLRDYAERFTGARLPGWAHRVLLEWSESVAPMSLAESMAAALLAGRTVGRIWHGPPGRGKSARACAVALHVLHIGGSVRWVQWPAYLAALKDRLADGRGIGTEIARDLLCPVLVVDELGAGRQTDFAAEVAERLVGGRAEAGRPMLVTTNLEPDALRDMVGDRVWSRLSAYRVTPVGGDDLRVAQGDRAWGVMR